MPRRALTRRGVLLAVLAVVAACAIGLLRTTGTGALQSIWEEDSRNILTEALYFSGAKAILTPLNGYYVIVARLLGEVATFFPIGWAAAVLSISAALVLGLMALLVYVASGAHLTSPLARLMVTVPMLVAPVAENNQSEIYSRPVCLHLFAMYALFWVVLWAPDRPVARWVAVGTVALAAGSTFLAIAYVPLALMRVMIRRDRAGVAMLVLLIAGGLANYLLGVAGGGAGRGVLYPHPLAALWDYGIWGVPGSILGFQAARGLNAFHFPTSQSVDVAGVLSANIWIIVLSWAVVAVIVATAATHRFTRPAGLLALAAIVQGIGLFCMMVMSQGNEQRYLLPVELLLFAALTLMLLPTDRLPILRGNAPLAAFAVFIAVVSAFNYRWDDTYRSHAPRWSQQIAKAAAACRDPLMRYTEVRSAPQPFGSVVWVPCSRLGTPRPWDCPAPECVPIGAHLPEAVSSGSTPPWPARTHDAP